MSHLVDFFYAHFGKGGGIIVGFVFFAMAILGLIIAFRGRNAMVWLVSVCAGTVGVLAGAMAGLLIFDSFIIMLVMAFAGGAVLLLLVKFVKSVGYFIGIGVLGFLLSYVATSEMYVTNTKITEQTLLAFDLLTGFVMGILSLIKSKYIISLVTAASGGMMTSISLLALFGFYFSDWKTWLLAGIVSVAGIMVQIKLYDLKPKKKQKPKRNKHEKRG